MPTIGGASIANDALRTSAHPITFVHLMALGLMFYGVVGFAQAECETEIIANSGSFENLLKYILDIALCSADGEIYSLIR